MDETDQITILLRRAREGDRDAESRLMPLIYERLHRIAEREFHSERLNHTLEPSALVSEVYMRLFRNASVDWQDRSHFFVVASQTIRRILVDHARASNAQRRPQPSHRIDLDHAILYAEDKPFEVLLIDEALEKLKAWNDRQAQVVELRFFGGLSIEETARALNVSERTVKSDWTLARAWLSAILNENQATNRTTA
jgi:RNA polymerase sigma factor (TIGR02999 family)